MYTGNLLGFGLAVSSSAFIGSSFIIKKKGLQRAASSGTRARSGGYGYLLEPLWWIGMFTMVVGEFANFIAYIYAPAVLVTPLGALSIIVSAVLAHFLLKEKLRRMGILGCVLCIVGSTVIVLHAPGEHSIHSVEEIWDLATQPAFLLYTASAIAVVLVLVLYCEPRYGQTNMMVYIGICSINGSLTVMSVKAIGIAIKLTLEGSSQRRRQGEPLLAIRRSCSRRVAAVLGLGRKGFDTEINMAWILRAAISSVGDSNFNRAAVMANWIAMGLELEEL
ncbi:hypothetical protein E3N88_22401 [Mikania micrantha]|uniref:Probable magnesium transporter n=1 Tax=Mikania micrantha TaxID=192012 RepID=A0A5N6NC51_9ASTR|nr:hypothetical protein E3N88_22401 [Mikania micrantha]